MEANPLRHLPSVDSILDAIRHDGHSRRALTAAARDTLAAVRDRVQRGELRSVPDFNDLLADIRERIAARSEPSLRPVINATGIIIHTGLGRAPLAVEAIDALAATAGRYTPVELDMRSGERGRRIDHVRGILKETTGAESATVVNNNAAALMVVLAAFARDRSVVVSRGELIEIGGSFRLPEIMRSGGAILREVGTTNRTRLRDYEDAIGSSTAAILRVHSSNYRIEGFTESVALAELSDLARRRSILLLDDIGSGLLRPVDHPALREEPDARSSLQAGADLVLFSGDKLLGGPQCGIIAGKKDLIDSIERHPMMRALRVDKLLLSTLHATLRLHRDFDFADSPLPAFRMLRATGDELRGRANRIVEQLRGCGGLREIDVVESHAFTGGGSVPTQAIDSIAVRIVGSSRSEDALAEALRCGEPPTIARRHQGAVLLELRTVFPDEDARLIAAVRDALQS